MIIWSIANDYDNLLSSNEVKETLNILTTLTSNFCNHNYAQLLPNRKNCKTPYTFLTIVLDWSLATSFFLDNKKPQPVS